MRNVLAIPAVLLVAVSSLSAQASLELAVSRATLRQSFAYDCCGPTRRTSGAGLGFRITWPAVRLIEAGFEGGASMTSRPDLRWLMAILAVAADRRVAPWARVGAGLGIQPGECPADAPDTSPDCQLALRPAGALAGGVRCRFGRFAVGVEAAWVSGTSDGFRRFSTEWYGLTLRMQP